MKAPKKVITAMALATILGGATVPAHAEFVRDAVSANTNPATQTSNNFSADANTTIEENGNITINGVFSKMVSTLPDPVDAGHYLRVTMPLTLDFTYDLDSNKMQSPDNTNVVNNSVEVKAAPAQGGTKETIEKQVKVSFIGLNENNLGANTINDKVEFVKVADKSAHPGKVQLPFELSINDGQEKYSLAAIKGNEVANNPLTIKAGASMNLKLQKIEGQEVANAGVVKLDKSTTSHSLEMRFEYMK